MKKLMSVLALFVAVVVSSFAYNVVAPTTESGSVNVREGRNVVKLRDGSTLQFIARGGEIAGVEVRKPTGQVIAFDDEGCPTCGAQSPKPCNGETRCVYSEKYKATICFCIPKPVFGIPGGGGTQATDFLITIEGVPGESK